MGLEELEDLVLHTILSKLGPKDSARAACVSNKLRSSASEDSLWSIFCFQDLDLKEPLDPLGNPTPSFKVSQHSFIPSLLGFHIPVFDILFCFLIIYHFESLFCMYVCMELNLYSLSNFSS
jgi:hypothetical protein